MLFQLKSNALRFASFIILFFTFLFCSIMQSLAVVTLGGYQMAQRIDNLVDTEDSKSFYLQVCEMPLLIECYIILLGQLPPTMFLICYTLFLDSFIHWKSLG